ncbi:MAG: CarboxypepD reg-like domain [Blastocatellia bacterium]|jgi:hypothetical protein|nr:CarboxypepD reg-like domain [Blastocatellia bacterium]
MARPSNTSPGVAIVTAILGIGFFVFVFVYDDLKSRPFIQGMSGLVFTLVASVILFSAVPGEAKIKGPFILGGAAAFFFLAVPRIEKLVFPAHTIFGTIYYVGTNRPVPDVSIRIPGTNQQVTTNNSGYFQMQAVPRRVTKLVANPGGEDYEFEIKEEDENPKYAIIPAPPPPPVRSRSTVIDPKDWQIHVDNQCSKEGEATNRKVTLLIWAKKISRLDDFSRLLVEVEPLGSSDITQTAKLEPPDIGGDFTDAEAPDKRDVRHLHQWVIPFVDKDKNVDLKEIDVKLAVCLGMDKNSIPVSSINASYWFLK